MDLNRGEDPKPQILNLQGQLTRDDMRPGVDIWKTDRTLPLLLLLLFVLL